MFDDGAVSPADLLDTPLGEMLVQAFHDIEAVQEALAGLVEQRDRPDLLAVKAGTVLSLALLRKLQVGKLPQDYSPDDWREVAETVADYALVMDAREYSVFVFSLYASYVEASVALVDGRASAESVGAIRALAEELRSKADELHDGRLSEVDYIESCLWISLEAMLKLLCAYSANLVGSERERLVSAIGQLAFEYGRYRLYAREREILACYLAEQRELDERLEREYESYLEEVQVQSGAFLDLVNDAFAPDIGERLRHSAELAKASGVNPEEVLDSEEKIDGFFLG